jgi:hypothetical protein
VWSCAVLLLLPLRQVHALPLLPLLSLLSLLRLLRLSCLQQPAPPHHLGPLRQRAPCPAAAGA